MRYEIELLTINGRTAPITVKELDSYHEKCTEWAGKKMEEFDSNPELAAKKKKKYEGRDGYKDFLDGEVAKKMQAYEGAREFATLFAEGGQMDKEEAANNTLRRIRIYLCPYAVCKHGMHDRGFVYLMTPSPMRELYFQGGFDQLGRRLARSVFIEYCTMDGNEGSNGFDNILKEIPEMEQVRDKLAKCVEEYDVTTHLVCLFLAGDGYCNVLQMQLVPDYQICLNLAEDYIDKDKIELKVD